MKRYLFVEQELKNEYKYVFLCGSHYVSSNERDKRNVLRKFLKEIDPFCRPIILEDNFIFRKDSSRYLRYDDIFMKDLYQVEMVTNYLSDHNIIIHESISTGAEIGLFLSEEKALMKTCLLLPDETAVEENKLGQFIRLAFLREPEAAVKAIKFYPQIEKNILSSDVKNWHTYFYQNNIGRNLGNQIRDFLNVEYLNYKIRFTKRKERVEEGYIYYKPKAGKLEITLLPRILLICIAAIFNIDQLSEQIFNTEGKELKEYIKDIKKYLLSVFIQTVEEKTGESYKECSVKAKMNVNRVYISGIIGMSLYMFQAAEFIEIVKAKDYSDSNKVQITRKMVVYEDKTKHFFYEKYSGCIGCAVERQIV